MQAGKNKWKLFTYTDGSQILVTLNDRPTDKEKGILLFTANENKDMGLHFEENDLEKVRETFKNLTSEVAYWEFKKQWENLKFKEKMQL